MRRVLFGLILSFVFAGAAWATCPCEGPPNTCTVEDPCWVAAQRFKYIVADIETGKYQNNIPPERVIPVLHRFVGRYTGTMRWEVHVLDTRSDPEAEPSFVPSIYLGSGSGCGGEACSQPPSPMAMCRLASGSTACSDWNFCSGHGWIVTQGMCSYVPWAGTCTPFEDPGCIWCICACDMDWDGDGIGDHCPPPDATWPPPPPPPHDSGGGGGCGQPPDWEPCMELMPCPWNGDSEDPLCADDEEDCQYCL